jgi:hypothetical protein
MPCAAGRPLLRKAWEGLDGTAKGSLGRAARQVLRHSSSIRSILKMTGLVPSERQAFMALSSRIQPRMMQSP